MAAEPADKPPQRTTGVLVLFDTRQSETPRTRRQRQRRRVEPSRLASSHSPYHAPQIGREPAHKLTVTAVLRRVTDAEPSDSCGFYWSICFRMNARRRFLNSDRGSAGCQAFAEAFARDAGIERTRRAHTRNSPIVRAASRHRSRFAHRSRDDRSRDNAARAPEPQGSASRLSIASGLVRDPCGVRGHPHSHRRLEQPSGRPTVKKSRAFSGRVVPFSSVEVSVRSNSHDKVVAACDLPLSL